MTIESQPEVESVHRNCLLLRDRMPLYSQVSQVVRGVQYLFLAYLYPTYISPLASGEVSESSVRFGHLVDFFAFLDGCAGVVVGIDEF